MVRFRNRYLLVEVHSDPRERRGSALHRVTSRHMVQCLRDAVTALHGEYGLACVQFSLNVKYMNGLTGMAIVRCPRAYHRAVWAAMSNITAINGTPCSISLVHLGGTIRSCQRHLVSHNRARLGQMVAAATTPLERTRLESMMKKILGNDTVPIPI